MATRIAPVTRGNLSKNSYCVWLTARIAALTGGNLSKVFVLSLAAYRSTPVTRGNLSKISYCQTQQTERIAPVEVLVKDFVFA